MTAMSPAPQAPSPSWLVRAWVWLKGDIQPATRHPDSPGLLALICLVAGLLMYVHWNVEVRHAPLLRGPFRGQVFFGGGIAALVGWQITAGGRHDLRDRLAGLLIIGLISLPLAVRLGGGQALFKAWGAPLLVLGWVGIALGLASGRRFGLAWRDWGLGLGDWRWWSSRTLVLAVLIVGGTVAVLALDPAMADFYPWYRPARRDPQILLQVQLAVVFDFVGWEGLFRGVLLFGLARRGDLHLAVWAQALLFFAAHENKPDVEFLVSLPAGAVAGYFAWRSKSFVPLWLLHALQLLCANWVATALRGGMIG